MAMEIGRIYTYMAICERSPTSRLPCSSKDRVARSGIATFREIVSRRGDQNAAFLHVLGGACSVWDRGEQRERKGCSECRSSICDERGCAIDAADFACLISAPRYLREVKHYRLAICAFSIPSIRSASIHLPCVLVLLCTKGWNFDNV